MYIRGKTSISAFVAITNGSILWAVGLDLFLAFGVLAFFLNFIPNVGMFTSVILPMPLIALDPTFSTLQIVLAFAAPLTVGMFAKDVLEPVILGHGTSLHPVCVLLAIMLFGSVWGVTGMVMVSARALPRSLWHVIRLMIDRRTGTRVAPRAARRRCRSRLCCASISRQSTTRCLGTWPKCSPEGGRVEMPRRGPSSSDGRRRGLERSCETDATCDAHNIPYP